MVADTNYKSEKMKKIIVMSLLVFNIACQAHQIEEIEPVHYLKNDIKEIDTTFFSFSGKHNSDEIDLKSKLQSKVTLLVESDSKYKLERIGKITKESSMVYKAVIKKPEINFSRKDNFKIRDLNKFKSSIKEINYARIRINKKNTTDYKTRAIVEELIFYSNEDAKMLISFLNNVRRIEYYWDSLDKYRSNMFREGNKVYFVSRRSLPLGNSYQLAITEKVREED